MKQLAGSHTAKWKSWELPQAVRLQSLSSARNTVAVHNTSSSLVGLLWADDKEMSVKDTAQCLINTKCLLEVSDCSHHHYR